MRFTGKKELELVLTNVRTGNDCLENPSYSSCFPKKVNDVLHTENRGIAT
jgi:hypothetical protein